MTTLEGRTPATTRRAIAAAAAVGTLALSAYDPTVAAAAGCGLVLAAVVSGFDGSARRVLLAAGVLPIGVIGAVAVVGLAGGVVAGVLSAIGALVALVVGSAVVGRPSTNAFERAATTALYAAFLAGGAAVCAFFVAEVGGARRAFGAAVWFAGDGVAGILVSTVVAVLAVGCALLALPPAAFATPSERDSYVRVRTALLWSVVAVGIVGAVAILVLTILSWILVPLDPLVAAIVDSAVVRGASAIVAAAGTVAAAFGLVVRHSWIRTDGRENPSVALLAGAVCGVLAPFSVVFAVLGAATTGSSFAAAAVALVAGWAIARLSVDPPESVTALAPGAVVGVALAIGGVAIGATVDTASGPLETARVGSISFVAIATGLCASDLERYGRTLAREVGSEGANERPQFVRAGWSAVVAAVGVLVAVLGLVAATLLAPTLSVPATAAVVVALATIVAGSWLLFG